MKKIPVTLVLIGMTILLLSYTAYAALGDPPVG